jgi:DNA repair protein RadC
MESNILASEHFSTRKRNYFLDFKLAANKTNFIQITRSDEQPDGTFKRNHVEVFEEDFHLLFQGLSSLFQHAAYLGMDKLSFKQQCTLDLDKKANGIKGWEPDMRPREKMLAHGAVALSDAELVALLIGSGTVKETAVGLSERILKSLDDDLENLAKVDYTTLGNFSGMGMAKCSSIMAAMELARRIVEVQLRSASVFLGAFEKAAK